MDQARTSPRTILIALLTALALTLLTLIVAAGSPGLTDDVAGNGWHRTPNVQAGNGWH